MRGARCHLPLPPPPGPPRIPLHSPGSAAAARLLSLRGRREQQRGVLGRGNCRLFASEKLSQAGGANPRGQSHRLTNFCLVALRFRRGFREAKRFRLLRGAGTAFGCSSRGPSGRAQQRSRRVSSPGALQTLLARAARPEAPRSSLSSLLAGQTRVSPLQSLFNSTSSASRCRSLQKDNF